MKCADVAIGESFQFDGPESDDSRYVRVDNHIVRLYSSNGTTVSAFKLDAEGLALYVKNVGKRFEVPDGEPDRKLSFSNGLQFIWTCNGDALSDDVSLEDVINAGYANHPRYAKLLVLLSFPHHSSVELALPVRRINENTLTFPKGHNNLDDFCLVRVTDGEFFLQDEQYPGGEIKMDTLQAQSFEQFIVYEARYAEAKILAEHEQEYLAAKPRLQM